jgi:uncharacterized protein (DUF849 family)
MRDARGLGATDKAFFKKNVELVKAKCDAVIHLTTSGDHRAGDDERMAHSDANWSAFGIGKAHLPILYATIARGGLSVSALKTTYPTTGTGRHPMSSWLNAPSG